MLIGEVTAPEGGIRRIGLVGSCRLHDPVKAAVLDAGGRFIWSAHNAFTHSPHEALQHLNYCLGKFDIPDAFAPYMLRQDHVPLLPAKLAEQVAACDVIVVEVSSFELLSCAGYFFNQDYFAQTFVRGKGLALLSWFRELGANPPRADLVAVAEAEIRAAGLPLTPTRREILRSIRKTVPQDGEIAEAIAGISALANKLVLMPIFNIAGGRPQLVEDRAALAARLQGFAAAAGADFIDPTPVLTRFGPAVGLDGEGADIFHYSPNFFATVGSALLQRILRGPEAVLEVPSELVKTGSRVEVGAKP